MEDLQTNQEFEAAFAPVPQPQPAPVAAAPIEHMPSGPVNVVTPDGEIGSIDGSQLAKAMEEGYQVATPDQVHQHFRKEKFEAPLQQAITGVEGAASALTGGLSTGFEVAAGLARPEDIQARREINPGVHAIGQGVGLVGSAFIPEVGAAGLMERAGAGAAEALGLGATSKIGSAAVKAAVENGLFQAGDEVSKAFSQDPNQTVQTAMADVGLAGMLGGVIGGGIGAAQPLWKSAVDSKLGGSLRSIAKRLGGIEGEGGAAVERLASEAGVDLAPEMRAALSDDPILNSSAQALLKSDTASGDAFRQGVSNLKRSADDSIVNALGKTSAEVEKLPELSKYQAGRNLGETLSSEFSEKVDPVSKTFDSLRDRYGHEELEKSAASKLKASADSLKEAQNQMAKNLRELQEASKSMNPEKAIEASAKLEEAQRVFNQLNEAAKSPGVTDRLVSNITDMAEKEGWTAMKSSDTMKLVRRVLKELPDQSTIKNLTDYATAVGNIGRSSMDPGVKRAAGMIRRSLLDAESDAISNVVGKTEGAAARQEYELARQRYRDLSQLKEELNDRLHTGEKSTSAFGRAVKEMAQTDGETLLNRLSGKNDAALLSFLDEHFPRTAEALKEHHVNALLDAAKKAAGPDEIISSKKLLKAIESMSPELRDYAISKQSQTKIKAVDKLMDAVRAAKFDRGPQRDLLGGTINAATLASAIVANPAHGVVNGIASMLGRNVLASATDGARLAFLKFMGTAKPVNATGFKATADMFGAALKGQQLVTKAAKGLFTSLDKPAISLAATSMTDRKRLDQMVQMAQTNPEQLMEVGKDQGHYSEEHGMAMAQTSVNALNYLAALRPTAVREHPLDNIPKPDPAKQAAYNRALDLANQPLSVVNRVKDGSVTPADIQGIRTMFPQLYNQLISQMTESAADHLGKNDNIPYRTKIGMSLFAGQPLDSTMTPQAIMAAQPKPQEQQQIPQQKPPSASSMKGISKMPSNYQTPTQAREQRAQRQ